MKSFIITYINITLFIHLIFSIILIFLLRLFMNESYSLNSKLLELTDDEYFVLNNSYDPKKIFYLITYKLYHNGILQLKMNEGKFYYIENDSQNLTITERKICEFYKDGLSPKEFNVQMANNDIFKDYFYTLYEDLISKKLIKSKEKILFDKILFYIGLFIIFIPGIIILIYSNGLFISKVFVNLSICSFIYIFFLKDIILNKLTKKGQRASKNFKEKNHYYSNKLTDNNYNNNMDKFLLQNIYMYYFDNNGDDPDDNDFDDSDE